MKLSKGKDLHYRRRTAANTQHSNLRTQTASKEHGTKNLVFSSLKLFLFQIQRKVSCEFLPLASLHWPLLIGGGLDQRSHLQTRTTTEYTILCPVIELLVSPTNPSLSFSSLKALCEATVERLGLVERSFVRSTGECVLQEAISLGGSKTCECLENERYLRRWVFCLRKYKYMQN